MLPKILKVAKLLGLHEVAKMPKRAIQVKRGKLSDRTQTSKVESFVLCVYALSGYCFVLWLWFLVWIKNSS